MMRREEKMTNRQKYWAHFKTICAHKWAVAQQCFRCGLIWQGLAHDASKFSFTEFWASAKYFQGDRSPIDAAKEIDGYSAAWFHHKGRNAHHWEYWIDNLGTYENKPTKMPYKYVVEMMCDWIGAGQVYNKDTWNVHQVSAYYNKVRPERIFHEETEALIETFLHIIDTQGLGGFYKAAKTSQYAYEHPQKEKMDG